MELSLNDFQAITKEIGQKEAQITRQEMTIATLRKQCQALEEEMRKLKECSEAWQAAAYVVHAQNEDLRQQMHYMHQVILLSVKKVQEYFDHMPDVKLQASLQAFVLQALPDETPPEILSFVTEVTRLRLPQPEGPRVVNVQGSYNDVHDNGNVECKM